MLLITPLVLSWGVRFFIWRELELAPFDLFVPALFLPFALFYSWIIASKKAVSFRKRILWIAYLVITPVTFGIFLVLATPRDEGGFVRVFGGLIFIVIALVSLGFTVWLSFNLGENPNRRLILIFRRLALFVLSILTVLIGVTVYKVMT